MMNGISDLPNDIDSLKALLLQAQLRIEQQSEEIRSLKETIQQFLARKFASSSERWEGQTLLFNEAEEAFVKQPSPADFEEVKGHKRQKRGRKPLPQNLPRVDAVYELTDDEKACTCGSPMREMGETVTEQLDVIPAKIQVIRHIRKKYVCPCCDGRFKTAPMPKQPIPGSIASAGLLAHVVTGKYVDGLPLYRQEEMLKRIGIDIPRATLANWMIQLGRLMTPMINLIRDHLLDGKAIVMDETHVQVLKEKGRKAQSKSYMWVMVRAGPGPKAVLFEYSPSRSAEVALRLLSGFEGVLISDGYAGYASVADALGLSHAGCWVHTRRKFFEAVKAGSGDGQSVADEGLKWIKLLFEIERRYKEEDPIERRRHRRLYSQSVIIHIRRWLDRHLGRITPRSKTGEALHYLNNHWHQLTRFLENGAIPTSNEAAENAIRPFVVGRKSWLFSNSVQGAEASASLYSLVETAKANGVEPYAYLRLLFHELPKASTLEECERLLPWNLNL